MIVMTAAFKNEKFPSAVNCMGSNLLWVYYRKHILLF